MDISDWWQVRMNLSGRKNEIEIFGEKRSINSFYGYMANIFSLPKDFTLDINGYYQSPYLDGSLKTTVDPNVNLALRKQFFNGKLSTTIHVNNIFDGGTMKLETKEKDFHKNLNVKYSYRELGFSLKYNFQTGKKIENKTVYSGAGDEKERLNPNSALF